MCKWQLMFSYTKPWSPVLWNNSASGRDSFPIHNIPLCSNETEVMRRIFALFHGWVRISKFLYFGSERIFLCVCPKTPEDLCYHKIIIKGEREYIFWDFVAFCCRSMAYHRHTGGQFEVILAMKYRPEWTIKELNGHQRRNQSDGA